MHSLGPGGKRRAFKAAGVGDKCAAQVRTGAEMHSHLGARTTTPAYVRVWAHTFTP